MDCLGFSCSRRGEAHRLVGVALDLVADALFLADVAGVRIITSTRRKLLFSSNIPQEPDSATGYLDPKKRLVCQGRKYS